MDFAARQTTGRVLLQEIEQFFLLDAQPDAFTVTRLTKAADGLQKVDAAEAFTVRAAIAALQWDQEQCSYWVKNALRLNSDVTTLHNAAVSFENMNMMDEALQFAKQAYELAPTNPTAARLYVHALYGVGRIAETERVMAQATELGMDLGETLPDAVGINGFCKAAGISEDRIAFEAKAAMSVLAASRKRASYLEHEVFADHDGEFTLIMKVGFVGSLRDELRLEADLAPILADEPGWDPCRLSTEFHYTANRIAHAVETI